MNSKSDPGTPDKEPGLTKEQRAMRARIGGLSVQAKYGSEVAARARRGLRAKFLRDVDPNGELPGDERERRADAAFRAHMTRLALQSSKARRRSKGAGGTVS